MHRASPAPGEPTREPRLTPPPPRRFSQWTKPGHGRGGSLHAWRRGAPEQHDGFYATRPGSPPSCWCWRCCFCRSPRATWPRPRGSAWSPASFTSAGKPVSPGTRVQILGDHRALFGEGVTAERGLAQNQYRIDIQSSLAPKGGAAFLFLPDYPGFAPRSLSLQPGRVVRVNVDVPAVGSPTAAAQPAATAKPTATTQPIAGVRPTQAIPTVPAPRRTLPTASPIPSTDMFPTLAPTAEEPAPEADNSVSRLSLAIFVISCVSLVASVGTGGYLLVRWRSRHNQ